MKILYEFDEKTCPHCERQQLKQLYPLVLYWCKFCGSLISVDLKCLGDKKQTYTLYVPELTEDEVWVRL